MINLRLWYRFIKTYRQISNIRHTLVGYKIAHHSDVIGASPFDAAPTTSSFSTWYTASTFCAKKTARRDEKHLVSGFGAYYIRDFTVVYMWNTMCGTIVRISVNCNAGDLTHSSVQKVLHDYRASWELYKRFPRYFISSWFSVRRCYPYLPRLLYWHCDTSTTAPVSVTLRLGNWENLLIRNWWYDNKIK